MAYIGRQQDGFGVRSRFIYTATGGQTTFTTDDSSNALSYSDGAYVDVYLNGVLLDPSDYTATSLTSIVLDSGATASDILEVIVYDIFSVFSGTFTNGITASEATVTGDLTVDTNTLYVDSTNNNVGIGDSTPEARLTVVEGQDDIAVVKARTTTTNGRASYQIGNDADNWFMGIDGGNSDAFFIADAVGSGDKLTITQGGNVGIGTTSPALAMDIVAASNSQLRIDSSDTNDTTFLLDYNGGGATNRIRVRNAAGDLAFNVSNTSEAMRIDSSGNVGIGYTTPSEKLGVNGFVGFAGSNGTTPPSNNPSICRPDSSNSMALFANGSEVVRISAAGNLLVGATGDSGKLFVNQQSTSSATVYSYANNASYSGVATRTRCRRTASSSYYLYWGESNNGGDVEFYVRGDGEVRADGTIAGGGADYAEMFEWDDGNSSNEDRRGFSVVLTNGNKIRKATSSDAAADIIGVVSANPTVLGDAEPMKWSGKYNTDDFGNYIMETYTLTEWTEPAVIDDDGEVTEEAVEHSYETDKIPSDLTVPSDAVVSSADGDGNTLKRRQLNPSYDDTQTYTPREERQEWDALGLMGKLRMRTGQPTGDRWIKMRDIATDDDGNVTVEEWLIR